LARPSASPAPASAPAVSLRGVHETYGDVLRLNGVAVFVVALTAIPMFLAQRLMRDTGGITSR